MKEIQVYLGFDGNCREAMTFYANALRADLHMMTFSEMPNAPKEAGDRIMHARLTKGPAVLMGSDGMPGAPYKTGNNFYVTLNLESAEEEDKVFAALGQEGKVTMPLGNQFWGARFGMLTDKFGVNWMFSYELPKQAG